MLTIFYLPGSRDMKIGIDISPTIGEKSGVGYYTANLVDSLAKIDRTNQYVLYPFFYHIYHPDFKTAVAPLEKNFHLRGEKIPKKIIDRVWHSTVPKKWILGKVDVLHSTIILRPAGSLWQTCRHHLRSHRFDRA